ncbi:hypothetical protein P0D88_08645 [Paraburkholderia sp. RL18-103-BIB-C]|jgi:hypothetical protein|uniref:hypothetical protein n=1 Tax=unclassified Paraburkholderia TaxID=2615204 RepID=UPI0038BC573F
MASHKLTHPMARHTPVCKAARVGSLTMPMAWLDSHGKNAVMAIPYESLCARESKALRFL